LAVVSGDTDCFSKSAEAEIVCIAVVALCPKMYNLARSRHNGVQLQTLSPVPQLSACFQPII